MLEAPRAVELQRSWNRLETPCSLPRIFSETRKLPLLLQNLRLRCAFTVNLTVEMRRLAASQTDRARKTGVMPRLLRDAIQFRAATAPARIQLAQYAAHEQIGDIAQSLGKHGIESVLCRIHSAMQSVERPRKPLGDSHRALLCSRQNVVVILAPALDLRAMDERTEKTSRCSPSISLVLTTSSVSVSRLA